MIYIVCKMVFDRCYDLETSKCVSIFNVLL